MDKFLAGVIGCLLCSCYVHGALKINSIIGPEYIEDGTIDELVLDCDFEANNETDIVVKWFLNGQEEQIYQWITDMGTANAMGPLKDVIDPTYKVTQDEATMLRALKFKEVNPGISGNYTCKVSGDNSDALMTKQVIVYSPATSFDIALILGTDGDETILCDAINVTPKPIFDLNIVGTNDSTEWPEGFIVNKTEAVDSFGYYNLSITLPFNSSYLEEGTTKFVCSLSIPGTNYSETKSVQRFIDNGLAPLRYSFITFFMLIFPLLLIT
ncbi:uncharacterized protein LOC143199171 isoform X2 [Rhynchophorus ferrugineus]|uniref:uncharacterized protein LOC143199171 isoform X2 n=1 Tax=Rhynchophorus ferrugineus TaxID=354439 RepID=UPI003FCC6BFD